MGRSKLGKEYKKPSDYSYDYPEQREISKGLRFGDAIIISQKTKYSSVMIGNMLSGTRKMTPRVKKIIDQLLLINKQIENIKVEQIAG